MKKLSILLFVLICLTGFLVADYYVKQTTHTDAFNMMGKETPAKDIISETWLENDKYAVVSKSTSTIIDVGKKVIFMINHDDRTYVEMTLPLEIEKYLGDQAKQTRMMMAGMTATVTPTEEKKKIDKWNCQAYDVKMSMGGMMEMNMKVWTTKDVPFDLKKIKKLQKISMELSGTLGGEKILKEFEKIDGFQIYSEIEVKVMGQSIKTTSKVSEIGKKTSPAGTYSIPSGYTKTEKLPLKRNM